MVFSREPITCRKVLEKAATEIEGICTKREVKKIIDAALRLHLEVVENDGKVVFLVPPLLVERKLFTKVRVKSLGGYVSGYISYPYSSEVALSRCTKLENYWKCVIVLV